MDNGGGQGGIGDAHRASQPRGQASDTTKHNIVRDRILTHWRQRSENDIGDNLFERHALKVGPRFRHRTASTSRQRTHAINSTIRAWRHWRLNITIRRRAQSLFDAHAGRVGRAAGESTALHAVI